MIRRRSRLADVRAMIFPRWTSVPMLSLQDVFSKSDVEAFVDRMLAGHAERPHAGSGKMIDGLSVALVMSSDGLCRD
jgi:NAD-dependent DNA ligase